MDWDWDWAVGGITDETPRTMGPECVNYMTNRRRWTEAVLLCTFFACVIKYYAKRIEPIQLPDPSELNKPHSPTRLMLLILMTFIFGIEMGFKLANRNVIYVLNPCHIQTLVQIYLLAAKPNKLSITLFRIQMNNLNGPFLAFIFPEVEGRTMPFEQATYWIQHAMLWIITAYILRTGAYKVEPIKDFKWPIIAVEAQLMYCFGVLNFFSIISGININKILCADESDPFQGDNYRIAATIHQSILCPILNKLTVLIFSTPESIQHSGTTTHNMHQAKNPSDQKQYSKIEATSTLHVYQTNQPAIREATGITSAAQLIHRKSNSLDYRRHHSSQHPLLKECEENKETVFNGDFIPEPDELDVEVIDPSATSATTETIKAEYNTMPTTKID